MDPRSKRLPDDNSPEDEYGQPATEVSAAASIRRALLVIAFGIFGAVVILELLAGPALRAAHRPHHDAEVLAIDGVTGMAHNGQVDPTEITQVAASQHQPSPLALAAQALLDGLLLVAATAFVLPRLLPGRDTSREARLASFIGSLVVLVGAIAVVVVATARLPYLVALYLSPPFGSLSYLLLYGSFRRSESLLAVTVVMVLKLSAYVIFYLAYPRGASEQTIGGLVVTSLAATVAVSFAYALAPSSLGSIIDALSAAFVALAAVLWAGVIVSASVRRLA